ncbi:MAG: type I phosphomannose isomerase catalytic subunit [Puniceicoccales bacterium]
MLTAPLLVLKIATMGLLSFEPIYQQRVWGGRGLEQKLGRSLPDSEPYGESWEVVDRPEAQSKIANGELAGMTLRDALENQSAILMGPGWDPHQPFPILVKWLDCKERLSLQVHPPADIAPELGGEPKTENWYVASAEPNSGLLVGLKQGATKEEFEHRLLNNTLEECVHRVNVTAGESMFVRSGRIHAIDGGNLILEIQQNSDTTYRVYDWGRVGLDGKPREMHIEQSLKCINFDDFEPSTIKPEPGEQQLVESEIFNLHKLPLADGGTFTVNGGEQPRLLSVVEGELTEAGGDKVARSQTVLLPYAEDFSFTAKGATTVLITEGFAG